MSFDLLAPHYRWLEIVLAGEKLQRCRTSFLDSVADTRSVLILGEGNGRFLTSFLKSNPAARVTCVDGSAKMLALARERIRRAGCDDRRVRFLHADALNFSAETDAFDLIVTHFFLDCFRPDQLERIIRQLAAAAKPGARWLLADFQEPTQGWKKWRARLILESMYAFFKIATRLPAARLASPDQFLCAQGFQLVERRERELGLLRSDLWVKSASSPSQLQETTCPPQQYCGGWT